MLLELELFKDLLLVLCFQEINNLLETLLQALLLIFHAYNFVPTRYSGRIQLFGALLNFIKTWKITQEQNDLTRTLLQNSLCIEFKFGKQHLIFYEFLNNLNKLDQLLFVVESIRFCARRIRCIFLSNHGVLQVSLLIQEMHKIGIRLFWVLAEQGVPVSYNLTSVLRLKHSMIFNVGINILFHLLRRDFVKLIVILSLLRLKHFALLLILVGRIIQK